MNPLAWDPGIVAVGLGAALFGFVLGLLVGSAWKDRRRGHTQGMALSRPRSFRLRLSTRALGLVAASIALAFSAISTGLAISNGARVDDLVECIGETSRADQEARDERASVAGSQTESDLAFLTAIREQTVDPTGTDEERLKRFLETIDAAIAAVNAVIEIRAENPYPRPDACADGHFDEDEFVDPDPVPPLPQPSPTTEGPTP